MAASRRTRNPPATLPELVRAAVLMVMIGAVLLAGGLFVLAIPSGEGFAWQIGQWLAVVLGILALFLGTSLFNSANRWRKLRQGQWHRVGVRVVPDQAPGEATKTLLDTTDGDWRIALLKYPLPLRDRARAVGAVEYAGQLKAEQPVLVRVPGEPAEHFGVPRLRSELDD